MQEVTPQYVAGLFDGEGCIHISRSFTKRGNVGYSIKINIVNTHLPVLLQIQKQFGGMFYSKPRTDTRYLPTHILEWGGRKKCRKILELIAPYVVIKKEQVDCILQEWLPLVNAKVCRFSKEAGQAREDIYFQMRALKKQRFAPTYYTPTYIQ